MGNGISGRGETKCRGNPSNVCRIEGGAVGVVHVMRQDTEVSTKVLQSTLVVFEFVEWERRSLHNGERAYIGPLAGLGLGQSPYVFFCWTLRPGKKHSVTDLAPPSPKNGVLISKNGNRQSSLH